MEMRMDVSAKGFIRIAEKEDREIVARILYKNGYTVSPARMKKDGKTYIQLVGYELGTKTIQEDGTA